MTMNAYTGKVLALALLIICLCATGCLAQEGEAVEAAQPDWDLVEDAPEDDGWDGEDEQSDPIPEAPAARERLVVTGLSVSLGRSVLLPGQQVRARVAFYPEDAGQVPLTWSTSDARVAAVDDNGLVRALDDPAVPDAGKDVDIWARSADGSLVMNCATVRVMPAVRALTLPDNSLELSCEGEDFVGVVVEIVPSDLVGVASVAWESSDPEVATVRASGAGEVAMVYAQGPGKAIITARAQDNSGCEDSLIVTVE